MVRRFFFLGSGREHQAIIGVFLPLGKSMRKTVVHYMLTFYVIKVVS
jgi:hypothetical protein